MKINRRRFLQVFGGAGVTLAVPSVIKPLREMNITEMLEGPKIISLTGGYDRKKDHSWIRVAVKQDGQEWNDRIVLFGDYFTSKRMTQSVNAVMARSNIRASVTVDQIEQAFAA